MREAGLVTDVKNGMAYIKFERTSACGKCHACGMLSGQNSITIKARNTVEASVGNRVSVEFTSKNALGSSAIAYLFPLAMLIVGLLLGLFLPVETGLDTEVFAAIMAISFVGIAFLILHLLEPLFRRVFANVYTITDIIE